IGYLIFVFDINRKNLPVTVILLIIGIALSFIPYFNDINLTNELVYSIFFSVLLFISAYHFLLFFFYIYILFIFFFILIIFFFVFDINRNNLPVTVILLIIGIALSFIPYFNDINLTNELVYSIFLPGLLFISAYQFSARALKKHRFVIGFLSTIGLILTVGLL